MKINSNNPITFQGPLDGAVTTTLRMFDKNPMVNAVGIDLVAMVGPRTYVDTVERNKYAGAETFFREFTGTLTVCLGASYIAKGIAWAANKLISPESKINTRSWFSNDSIEFLREAHNNTNSAKEYISNVVDTIEFKNTSSELIEESRWRNYKWDNKDYSEIYKRVKDKESLINELTNIVEDKNLSFADKKRLVQILDLRVTNLTGKDSVNTEINGKKLSGSVASFLRDTIDMGSDVFSKSDAEQKKLISKILKINKIKNLGAIAIAASLGLVNQYVNRKITEKRTGTKGFVGDVDYNNKVANQQSTKDNSKKFFMEKLAASIGMGIMAVTVMRVKSLKDFVKKLELTGPVTSGNAIKTVYAATLIGRFMASDNKDELRETVTRDYLGLLNWLVLGGFAAKGVANILDPKRKELFNEAKKGKGIKHWLNELSLKSHNEIAVKGTKFAKKNMWKLNLAQAAGLAYSTIALGILLPKLNIWVTNKKYKES